MMKKILVFLLGFICFHSVVLHAQDAKKAVANAKKSLNIYHLDNGKVESLTEASQEIEKAISDTGNEIYQLANTWQLRGDVFAAIATQIVIYHSFGTGDISKLPKVNNPAVIAFESFSKALELADKKYETHEALNGLMNIQSNLYSLGIMLFENADYESAFSNFKAVLASHELLKKHDKPSSLDQEKAHDDLVFVTGLTALNAEKYDSAKTYFENLYLKKYDNPAIYEALFNLYREDDLSKAYSFLEQGRKAYPDDVALLFAEINYFLQTNQLDKLISKIELAISKEPDNITLYSTLGNVYDNLYQNELNAGNNAMADEYFKKAMENYTIGITKNPEHFDLQYSIGAIYYNKAAFMTQELNALENDVSKEGIKKYNEMRDDILAQFDKALPYFQKAESLNPNDVNTLIALKEIYARKDQLDISNEFKARLEKVQNGDTNNSSYFKN